MVLTTILLASAVSFPADGLRTRIDFWKSVFTDYGSNHLIFHDTHHVHLIYHVTDLTAEGIASDDMASQRRLQALHRERLATDLIAVATRLPEEMTQSQRSLARVIQSSGVSESPRQLADRIHVQRGIREKFSEGLRRYDGYRQMVERILREENVPDDLAALPLVESSYMNTALSRTGAAGIWQFMPRTARQYMKVTASVDERLNPTVATRSAARLLRHNYQLLGAWPLAISAYNHGAGGILRAKNQCGGSVARIITCYRSPSFGYASMNFYAEFLAALELLQEHRRRSMPQLAVDRTEGSTTQSYRVRKGDTLIQLSRKFQTTLQELMALNRLKDPHRLVAGTIILVPKG
jgi:membrane-bound lytic murein transglycosylase D